LLVDGGVQAGLVPSYFCRHGKNLENVTVADI